MLNPTSKKHHVLFTSTCLGEGKNLQTGKHVSILLLKVAQLSRSFILVIKKLTHPRIQADKAG